MELQPNVTGRKMGSEVPPRAYRIDDFCRSFGVGRTTVYALLKNGTLRSVKIGRRRLITADSGEALLSPGAA
jgi:excisionase family DNA binding protein